MSKTNQTKTSTARVGSSQRISGPQGMGRGVVEKPKNFKKSLKKLSLYTKNQGKLIIFAIVMSIFAAMFSVVGPLFLGKITDQLHISLLNSTPLDLNLISSIGIMLVCFYVLSLIFNYAQGFIMSKVSNQIGKNMRTEISQKINKMPLKYFDTVSVGDTMSKITNDVTTVTTTLSQSFGSGIISITRVLCIITIMFILSPQLTLISVISIPLTVLAMSFIMKKSQKYFASQQEQLGKINGHAEETYSAHNIVNVFNASDRMVEKFEKINDDLYKSTYKSTFLSGIIQPAAMFITNLTYLIVCLVGANLVFEGVILIGAIASFVLYIRQIGHPLAEIATIAGTLQSTVAAAERVFELLEQEEQVNEDGKPAHFENGKVKGKVEFKNVSFGYDEGKEVIHNFNFVANPGEKIAIVGPTGAGKTTLINLLMRFYEVNSGEILIDEKPTKEVKREDVRKLFGMVLQDSWLFEGTIKENIAYGVDNITDEEVEKACQTANIDHFVKTLPNGYNTILDESTSLSQGQKQLLTIARATMQNAPMLILDEATSSVDTRTEILIQQAMDRLTRKRTSFVIAHRLSTIQNADKIIVMKEGRIIEIGNHEELLLQNGFYAELYNSQFDEWFVYN